MLVGVKGDSFGCTMKRRVGGDLRFRQTDAYNRRLRDLSSSLPAFALGEAGHLAQGLLHHLCACRGALLGLGRLLGSVCLVARDLPHSRRRPPLALLSLHDDQVAYLLGACLRLEGLQLLQLVKHHLLPLFLVGIDEALDLLHRQHTQALANFRTRREATAS